MMTAKVCLRPVDSPLLSTHLILNRLILVGLGMLLRLSLPCPPPCLRTGFGLLRTGAVAVSHQCCPFRMLFVPMRAYIK